MEFSLTTLGTASARPTIDKYPSAHLLRVGGRLFLIDCGEAAQMQLVRSRVSIIKIDNIFLSHLHGDHVFGLFGLIYTMDMIGRLAPLHIYAPDGLEEVINIIFEKFGTINYELALHTIKATEPTNILNFKQLDIFAFPLQHRVETYGFLFKGYWRNNPRSFAYCSDTAPFKELQDWLQGVSTIYHEATYALDNKLLAKKTNHSTSTDAAKLAKAVGAKQLLLGHFSSRYKSLSPLLEEAKKIFPSTIIAKDCTTYDIL